GQARGLAGHPSLAGTAVATRGGPPGVGDAKGNADDAGGPDETLWAGRSVWRLIPATHAAARAHSRRSLRSAPWPLRTTRTCGRLIERLFGIRNRRAVARVIRRQVVLLVEGRLQLRIVRGLAAHQRQQGDRQP